MCRREVQGDGHLGVNHGEVPDDMPALRLRRGQRRLDGEYRVDLVAVQRRDHVGETDRDYVDAVAVAPILRDQFPDGQLDDGLERVRGDLLACQLTRPGDRGVLYDETVEVRARLAGGGVPGGDRLDRHTVGLRDEDRRGVAEAELVLPAGDGGNDVGATRGGVRRQVDVLPEEEALLLAEVDRCDVNDRDEFRDDLVWHGAERRRLWG